MQKGVDYSFSRPNPTELKQLGYDFAVRYIPYAGTSKGLSKTELQSLNNAGLSVCMVFESTANRALSGRAAGQTDASIADIATKELGIINRPIYFAVDFDATPQQQVAIDEYLRGVAEVIGKGRVGVYASFYVCARCLNNGTATWLWQTYAWSGGNKLEQRHIYQYKNGQSIAGGTVDLNESYPTDFGQYPLYGGTEVTQAQADEQSLQDGYIQEVGDWAPQEYVADWKKSGLAPYTYNQQHIQRSAHAAVAEQATEPYIVQVDDLQTQLDKEMELNKELTQYSDTLEAQNAELSKSLHECQTSSPDSSIVVIINWVKNLFRKSEGGVS